MNNPRPEDAAEPNHNLFIRTVISWMKAGKMSRELAAAALGISFYTLTSILAGKRPSVATLAKLAAGGVELTREIVAGL